MFEGIVLKRFRFLAKEQTNPKQFLTMKVQNPKFYLKLQSLFHKTIRGKKKEVLQMNKCHQDIKCIGFFC